MKYYYIVFTNGFIQYIKAKSDRKALIEARILASEAKPETFVRSIWKEDKEGEFTINVW